MINSLRHRLVFFVLLVVTVLAAVLTTVAYQHTYAAAEAGVRQNIAATTANKVAFINEWVHSRQRVVGSVLPRFGHGELKPVLDQALEAGGFDDMYVGQPDKTMTQFSKATLVPAGYDPTVRPWYVAAAATEGPIASPPYIDASTKQPIITFAQGLRRNGQLVAVAGGDVTLKRVVEEVTAAQLPGNGYAFLITQDGAVIAHPAADSALKKISEVVPGLTPDSVPRDGAIHTTTLNGVKYFMVLQPVGKTGWLMGALVPHDAALAPVQHMLYTLLGVLAACIALASVAAWLGIAQLMRGLASMRDAMRSVASGSGDLTLRLPVKGNDELAEIAQAFNQFVAALQQMFTQVRQYAESLADTAEQLDRTAGQIAEDSRSQASELANTAATIEQVTVSINHIAEHVGETEALVTRSRQGSISSQDGMEAVAQEMHAVVGAIASLRSVMDGLSSKSEEIRGIVNTIHDIADQTNLLALNAAIEAARAGEQGRGFAVVADEVRKLAERTSTATVQIASIMDQVIDQTGDAAEHVGSTQQRVTQSMRHTEEAAGRVARVREHTDDIAQRMANIKMATAEQGSATHDMARSAERVNAKTQQTDGNLQQVLGTLHGLAQCGESLKALVSRFKL
ncbi:methyl-accepting chemotaxis protein [Rivihabitans pingtungensis]|uniref:methyl-accepting chemotaxis protein n=1 Tax=Rivihabitans pingtungensis TaxID=1054498 RepID=UPI002CD49269|nr:methyl-accepting chemotaxis protein [Rivihabitans pingtungensis]HNX70880.1 methyl-accepting chemotaxis protein [Rivihabitans pingtungensis]